MNAINKLIGQNQAKRCMNRIAWKVRENQPGIIDSPCFIGPTGSGKTEACRAMFRAAGVPLLELQPQSIPKANDLYDEIMNFELPQEMIDEYEESGIPARFGIMIDEVQQVTKSMEQCLLKALEPKDRMLVTEDGRKLDTSRLLFAFCTTDIGDLFDALVCRLMPVEIRLYSKVEMAQIIALNYPHWPGEACRKVAHYSSQNPRESLRFAKTMQDEIDMREDMGENADYLVVSDYVARESNIDPHGMTMQRLRVLTALGHQPVSAARLRHVCGVKDSELYKFILPPLLSTTPDQPAPLLTVSNKGYTITPAGLAELDKREIGNRGIEAIPKSVRSLFKIEPVSRKKTYGDLQPSDLE